MTLAEAQRVFGYEWRFLAQILRHVDADTYETEPDQGFTSRRIEVIRLAGVDAAEIAAPEHRAALEFVRGAIPVGCIVRIRTHKNTRGTDVRTFGRYVGDVAYEQGGVVRDLATEMVSRELAIPYDGGGRR